VAATMQHVRHYIAETTDKQTDKQNGQHRRAKQQGFNK